MQRCAPPTATGRWATNNTRAEEGGSASADLPTRQTAEAQSSRERGSRARRADHPLDSSVCSCAALMSRLLQWARQARASAGTMCAARLHSPITRCTTVRRAVHQTHATQHHAARAQHMEWNDTRTMQHTSAVDNSTAPTYASSAAPSRAALPASPLPAAFVAALQQADFVEAERIALQLSHAHSDGSSHPTDAAPAAAPLAPVFHTLFRSLLDATMDPERRRDTQFPASMRVAQLDGPLLSFCAGTQSADADSTAANDGNPSDDTPRFVREVFQPDYHFSTRVWGRVEASLHSQSFSSASASSTATAASPPSDHTHARWLLTLALEDVRKHEESIACSDAESIPDEVAEAPNNSNDASTRPLPPLSLVRHLFSALLAADLRPTVQCFNLIIAIHDEHARRMVERRGAQAMADQLTRDELQLDAQAEPALAESDGPSDSLSNATASADDDLEWLWHLWLDAEKHHGVHADLLSHVLMLRLCYRHRQYSYMSRMLHEFDRRASLVAHTLPVLNHHVFSHPQLLLAALTHSSKASSRIDSNQRLEFLGDAVLDVLVRESLVTQTFLHCGLPLRPGDQLAREQWPPDASSPDLLRHLGISSSTLVQLKGKHVSFHVLAGLARKHGLTRILLEANSDVRNGIKRWIESSEEARSTAIRLQERYTRHQYAAPAVPAPASPSSSSAAASSLHPPELDVIGDHLAEDVFEACLGALLLDRPLAAQEQIDAVPASDEMIRTPNSSATRRGQSYGLTAVREFLQLTLGKQLDRDLASALSRARSRQPHHRALRFHEFDEDVNYKLLLESHARRQFTDEHGVCHAHVLYQLTRLRGAHLFGVHAILRPTLPDDISFAQYLPRGSSLLDFSCLPASSSAHQATAPISFSVGLNVPDLMPADEIFETVEAGPTQHNAEQVAAFRACQQLRLLPTVVAIANAAISSSTTDPSSIVPSSSVPFPFQSEAEYAVLLDRLQRLTSHRFRNPMLVRALFLHAGPLSRNLEFLGSGVWRFLVSHFAYTLYPECDEGSLTRIKDLMAQRIYSQEPMFAEPFRSELDEIRGMLERAKQQWPTNVRPANSASIDPHQLVLPGDLLEPLLAALYLDGGVAAVDPFAHRVLRPRLEQVHEMLRAELPDRDLHSYAYKERVQQFVQRVYGVTPQLQVVAGVPDRVCSVRLVIPAARVRGAPLVDSPEIAFKDAPLPGSVLAEPRDYIIVFPSCRATKSVAEMRAARLAFIMLTAHKRIDGAATGSAAGDQLEMEQWRPHDLRGVLHSIARQLPTAWADEARAQQLSEQLQRLVTALLQPDARFVAFPIPPVSSDSPEAAAQSSVSESSRWRFSDYTLLLELLQRCDDCGSSFSALWQLLTDIDYPLSASTAHSLIDDFASEGSMGLIIQMLRRIKIQSRWIPDGSLVHRAMLRCTQANPLWGWQQMPKLMETAIEGGDGQGSIDVVVANSALYMCARSLWCLTSPERRLQFELSQPAAVASALLQVNISPHMVMRTADELRAKLAKAQMEPNEVTLALLVILDAYAGRIVQARWALDLLMMRVRERVPDIDQKEQVRSGLLCLAKLEEQKRALPSINRLRAATHVLSGPFTLRAPSPKASRVEIERFSEQAEPLVAAVEFMCAAMHD